MCPGASPEPPKAEIDADAEIVAGGKPPSERLPLSRDLIVRTAIAFIEEFGLPELTMRRLGQTLGVEAMSLYRYVPGREDLLDAVVERIIAEMRDDPDVLDDPDHGWQDFLQRLAHGVRRMALAHPKCFPLVASRPAAAPWLRPPLRSLDWVETFLRGLTDAGFTDDAAVAAYRAFTSFLLGHLLLEVSALGADVGPLDFLEGAGPDEPDASGSLGPFPMVRRLAERLAQDTAVVEFEESLEGLLERINAMLSHA